MHDLNKTTRIELSNRPGEFVLLCEAGAAFIAANDIRSIYISMDGARRYGYVDYYKPDSLGETAPLARALAGASKGQIVRYHDGDTKNLRLSNLRLVPRASARRQNTDGDAA